MKHPRNEHGPPSTTLETICYPPRRRSSPPATKHRDAGATLLYLSSPPPQFSRIEGAGAISRLSDSAELGRASCRAMESPSPRRRSEGSRFVIPPVFFKGRRRGPDERGKRKVNFQVG